MRNVGVWLLAALATAGGALIAQEKPQAPKQYVVRSGTRIPLVLVNSVSTRTSNVGDRVYLQTSFPISIDSRIVLPEGTYVTGTITQVKRPGRVRGKGEIYVRFDTLMLRNGVTRDFRGTVSAVDGAGNETLHEGNGEGTVQGEATKGEDAGTIAQTGGSGATIGAIAGGGKGAAIGAGIGAAAGLGAVLLTRGAEVRLLRGTALEMQLDRDLTFAADEISLLGAPPAAPLPSPPSAAPGGGGRSDSPFPRIPRPF